MPRVPKVDEIGTVPEISNNFFGVLSRFLAMARYPDSQNLSVNHVLIKSSLKSVADVFRARFGNVNPLALNI